jgi:hypothetical protein
MLCMFMLMLIILCHFHCKVSPAVEDLSSLLGAITSFLFTYEANPVVGDLSSLLGVITPFFVMHEANPIVGDLSSLLGDVTSFFVMHGVSTTKVESCFHYIAHAMIMLMLSEL